MRILFCAAIACGVTSAAPGAPVVWGPGSGGNGHAYEVVAAPAGISQDGARAAARAAGGELASVTSAAENAFVFGLTDSAAYWYDFDPVNGIGPWLGGAQAGGPEPAGGWAWFSGEPFAYANWAPNQPDNFSGEDRLHYQANGGGRASTWNDLQNDGGVLPRAYVVEYVPEPAGVTLAIAAGVAGLARRRPSRPRGAGRARG